MASNAYENFEVNLRDVERLRDSHTKLNHGGGGRRGLGHLTRSGIFMLCAAWEVYHEELLEECVEIITQNVELPKQLPRPIKKVLVGHYDNLKDKSSLLNIAGDGWKTVYSNICKSEMSRLNSPKAAILNKAYKDYIAVENVSTFWTIKGEEIDKFVKIRGDIANNGGGAQYIRINCLEVYIKSIKNTVIENDNAILEHMKDNYISGRAPWYRINI